MLYDIIGNVKEGRETLFTKVDFHFIEKFNNNLEKNESPKALLTLSLPL